MRIKDASPRIYDCEVHAQKENICSSGTVQHDSKHHAVNYNHWTKTVSSWIRRLNVVKIKTPLK